MKHIFFTMTLLLGSQVAFGMEKNETPKTIPHYYGTVKAIPRRHYFRIRTINWDESENSITFSATLDNGELITTDFFIAGPQKDSFRCIHSKKDKNGDFIVTPLGDNAWYELRDLIMANDY